MKLSSVMLGTEDSVKLADFYTKMLGKPGWEQGGWFGYATGETNILIGPHSEVKGRNQSPGRIIINFETNDINTEFARIKDCGAAVVAEPYQPDKEENPDTWLATLADPDGNYVQLATPWKS